MKKLFAVAVIGVALVAALSALAQPYYTNSTPANGAYLPNAGVTPPTAPSQVQNNQYALGIITGQGYCSGDGTVTNTFPTNYVYSVAPTVVCSQFTNGANGTLTSTNWAYAITTTNFIYKGCATNVWFKYIAVGK